MLSVRLLRINKMLTIIVFAVEELGCTTLILVGCAVIATFAGIVCITFGKHCADFDVDFS